MKNPHVSAFVEGFKDSFRLAAALWAALVSTMVEFANSSHERPSSLPEAPAVPDTAKATRAGAKPVKKSD